MKEPRESLDEQACREWVDHITWSSIKAVEEWVTPENVRLLLLHLHRGIGMRERRIRELEEQVRELS